MKRVTLVTLGLTLAILLGCGDEEQGFPNPLQIEFLGHEEEPSSEAEPLSLEGSITGQVVFTDSEGQIQARPLSSNEYVILQGSSARTPGVALSIFVDFPSNNRTYLMEDGYFQIKDVAPGTHELILTHTADAVIKGDPDTLPEGSFAEIDVPTRRWTVTVEPNRNTTTGPLAVTIPELQWNQGKGGQEIVIPKEPETPVVPVEPPIRPPAKPQPIDEEGLWFYYDFDGVEINPSIVAGLSGYEDPGFQDSAATIELAGAPKLVRGILGNAWQFNGVSDRINLNDFEAFEKVFSEETVSVWFNVDDTDRGGQVDPITHAIELPGISKNTPD